MTGDVPPPPPTSSPAEQPDTADVPDVPPSPPQPAPDPLVALAPCIASRAPCLRCGYPREGLRDNAPCPECGERAPPVWALVVQGPMGSVSRLQRLILIIVTLLVLGCAGANGIAFRIHAMSVVCGSLMLLLIVLELRAWQGSAGSKRWSFSAGGVTHIAGAIRKRISWEDLHAPATLGSRGRRLMLRAVRWIRPNQFMEIRLPPETAEALCRAAKSMREKGRATQGASPADDDPTPHRICRWCGACRPLVPLPRPSPSTATAAPSACPLCAAPDPPELFTIAGRSSPTSQRLVTIPAALRLTGCILLAVSFTVYGSMVAVGVQPMLVGFAACCGIPAIPLLLPLTRGARHAFDVLWRSESFRDRVWEVTGDSLTSVDREREAVVPLVAIRSIREVERRGAWRQLHADLRNTNVELPDLWVTADADASIACLERRLATTGSEPPP